MLIYSSHVQIFFYISTNHVCYPFDSFTLSMHLGEASIVSKSVFTSTACFTSLGMEKDVWSANQIWLSHLQVFFLVFMSFRKWKRRLLLQEKSLRFGTTFSNSIFFLSFFLLKPLQGTQVHPQDLLEWSPDLKRGPFQESKVFSWTEAQISCIF